MRIPLIPRETKFFDMFVEDARNVLAAARLLEQFFRNYDDRERLASQLRDAEHVGDAISHEIGHKLESTFVTPFDREDIHALISRLDDILDLIEEVADTCILYNIDAPTPPAMEQAEIITRQCEQLAQGLVKLRHFKGVEPFWIEVHRLENEGIGSHGRRSPSSSSTARRRWTSSSGRTSMPLLEKAIDTAEDAANVIERIVVKHA